MMVALSALLMVVLLQSASAWSHWHQKLTSRTPRTSFHLLATSHGTGTAQETHYSNAPWQAIKHLPDYYRSNPWPTPKGASGSLPLEQLVPFFLLLSLTHGLQSGLVGMATPASFVKRVQNTYSVVTAKAKLPEITGVTGWVPISKFDRCLTSNQDDVMSAYLMMSFYSKCHMVVSAFAGLLFRSSNTHTITYKGERIIGWSVQDGALKLESNRIPALDVVTIPLETELSSVAHAISNGLQLPASAEAMEIGRNDVHVWLTFVTESGGMFDLDLSSLQFGACGLPFPCILPIHNVNEPTALQGHCDRKRVLSVSFDECMQTVYEIIDNHVNLVNTMPNKPNLTPAQVWDTLGVLVNTALTHADAELPILLLSLAASRDCCGP